MKPGGNEEITRRSHAVRGLMTETNAQVFISTTPESVLYFSGALIHTQQLIQRRRAAVLIPMDGEASLIVSNLERGLAERENELPTLETYSDLHESVIAHAAAVLAKRGLDEGKIAVEMDGLSAVDADLLRGVFPGVQLIAVDDAVGRMRWLKSPSELYALRDSAHVLDRAISSVAAGSSAGTAEYEIARRIAAAAASLGGGHIQSPVGLVAAGQNLRVSHHVASSSSVPDDAFIRLGCRATWRGYHSMVVRTGVTGNVPSASLERYRRLAHAHVDLIASLRPGTTAGEVFERASASRASADIPVTTPHVGHGIGLGFQEDPYLAESGRTVLQPGMVLVAASIFNDPQAGNLYLEDMIRVSDEGPQLLSDFAEQSDPLRLMSAHELGGVP